MPWRIKNAEQCVIERLRQAIQVQSTATEKLTDLQQSHNNARSETKMDISSQCDMKI